MTMASIMYHKPGQPHPERIEQGLKGSLAVSRLKFVASTIAKNTGAELLWLNELEAKLEWPSGKNGSVYLEAYTPSSKPERGQGRLWEGGGVVLLSNGALVSLNKPKGKEPAE
jgi:hypothetical protein